MKTHITLVLFACLTVACCSCRQAAETLVEGGHDQAEMDATRTPETLVEGGYDQAEMDAAIARARSEVDSFIADLSSGNGTDFAVKAPIEDNGEVEHFWLTEVVYRDASFEGVIGNEPGIVTNVALGQKWTVSKSEISDWMFMRDGKMHGNYTLRPLLATLPADEAADLRSMLANP